MPGPHATTPEEFADITERFTYHRPNTGQVERYQLIREQAGMLADQLISNCPPSCERSLALTKLEEAVFWANASIARNE